MAVITTLLIITVITRLEGGNSGSAHQRWSHRESVTDIAPLIYLRGGRASRVVRSCTSYVRALRSHTPPTAPAAAAVTDSATPPATSHPRAHLQGFVVARVSYVAARTPAGGRTIGSSGSELKWLPGETFHFWRAAGEEILSRGPK